MPSYRKRYIISPQARLIKLLPKSEKVFRFWYQSGVYELEMLGDPDSDRDRYYLAKIKLTFLLDLIFHNKALDSANATIFDMVFGNPPVYTLESVDVWWTVTPVNYGSTLDYQLLVARIEDMEKILIQGDPRLEEWLQRQIQSKKKDKK